MASKEGAKTVAKGSENAPDSPDIAVLLPCYNEAGAIGQVVRDFRAALPEAAIYVYDNNSTDNTVEEARDAGAIIRHETRQGKGYVIRRAFAQVDAEIYVIADGDGTYDATQASNMVKTLLDEQLDMVVGARKHDDDEAYRRGHQIGNKVFNSSVGPIIVIDIDGRSA